MFQLCIKSISFAHYISLFSYFCLHIYNTQRLFSLTCFDIILVNIIKFQTFQIAANLRALFSSRLYKIPYIYWKGSYQSWYTLCQYKYFYYDHLACILYKHSRFSYRYTCPAFFLLYFVITSTSIEECLINFSIL